MLMWNKTNQESLKIGDTIKNEKGLIYLVIKQIHKYGLLNLKSGVVDVEANTLEELQKEVSSFIDKYIDLKIEELEEIQTNKSKENKITLGEMLKYIFSTKIILYRNGESHYYVDRELIPKELLDRYVSYKGIVAQSVNEIEIEIENIK